jgi:signal transduction histidine kinase
MPRLLALRPALVDALVAAGLVVMTLVESVTSETNRAPSVHAVLSTAVMAAVAWRRRFPLTVVGVVVAGVLIIDPNGQFAVFAALVIVSLTAGMELDPPRAWVGLVLLLVPFWVSYALTEGAVSDFVAVTVLYGGSWLVGQTLRERTRRSVEATERAERAERERRAEAERAVAEERARIARELHDVVAHSISVIAVQTQAVRRRLGPEHAREADDLRGVEATARQAMGEMRRLFGVLRADGERPSLAPQPGLDQLDRLVAETQGAGQPVEVVVEGTAVPLSPGLGLAAYRIVQEAVTNVRKHAPGGQVTVRLRYGEADLDVWVEDTGGPPGDPADAGGLGLVGMRERVALYGGTLEAGPRPGGGFRVRARLPVREGAAA